MTLTESSNVAQIKEFLLFHMDSANDSKSRINPRFTKEQMWNVFMGAVLELPDDGHIDNLAVRNIIREFGSWWDGESE